MIFSDSGRETLLDELKAEGDGSPLPSGVWSNHCLPSKVEVGTANESCLIEANQNVATKCQATKNEIDIEKDVSNDSKKLVDNSVPQRTFKVILAGDSSVGKSTFIERACNDRFSPNLSSTIGMHNLLF